MDNCEACTKLGLTAERAAHLILDNGWESFGIPSVITSDQGLQFVGQWWKTMCARLGIRQAFSQAYRPQANGRAEVAGKSLISILRKLNAKEHVNWVEALPRVLRMYHDVVGEGGLSPFQIVFGRDRGLAGVPYEIPRTCAGAEVFMARMEEIDRKVARVLNEAHQKEAARVNAHRSAPTPYAKGDLVWVLRPKTTTVSKWDTWWVGPCEVACRVGELSYEVFVKPGVVQSVHAQQLKPYVHDVLSGRGVELYHHMTGYQGLETAPDEWEVKAILGHREKEGGRCEFLTRWEGCQEGEETWEPPSSFVTHYNKDFARYVERHGLTIGLREALVSHA